MHDGETESGAPSERAAERVEHALQLLGRYSHTLVPHREHEAARSFLPGPRRVEAVLQGDRAAVEKVVGFLREGPPGSSVTDIAVSWGPPSEVYRGFHIRY